MVQGVLAEHGVLAGYGVLAECLVPEINNRIALDDALKKRRWGKE
jgi:hypothetical protein